MIDWLEVLKLTGGLVYLLVGGDLLVRGAIGFSARTRAIRVRLRSRCRTQCHRDRKRRW